MNYEKLAELLFPEIDKTPQYYENLFPERKLQDGAKVTRLAPSPTGFIHLGNLYGAIADERLAHQSNGIFYLRIEDTDDKRYVDGAVDVIINSLKYFGISFNEGAMSDSQIGEYGDYYQSNRCEIYQCFVKELVKNGMAYPCFLTPEQLEKIHEEQEENKENFGIYGKWAVNRDLPFDDIEKRIVFGMPYVIRLRSSGNLDLPRNNIRTISVEDSIRGTLIMPENDQDIVILKTNGMPTYHFAHVIDDHLMRTTHVIRGAEWLPSLPVHIELFEKLGFEPPIYCHTAQLMKIGEDGNKRKLSKRKDPELSLDYYRQLGYHPLAVKEYLMTILNSNFEEWRIQNPYTPIDEFEFAVEKMGNAGALFDLNKLDDVSKNVIAKLSSEEIYDFILSWAKEFNGKAYSVMSDKKDYTLKIIDIGRGGDKPRKDLIYASQIFDFIKYFYDECFVISEEKPENISTDDAVKILTDYINTYDHSDDQIAWFNKIKEICLDIGYAIRPKDYKNDPEKYSGHIGHVSTLIRLAIVGKTQSPDVWEIQQILGEEKTKDRIYNMVNVVSLPI